MIVMKDLIILYVQQLQNLIFLSVTYKIESTWNFVFIWAILIRWKVIGSLKRKILWDSYKNTQSEQKNIYKVINNSYRFQGKIINVFKKSNSKKDPMNSVNIVSRLLIEVFNSFDYFVLKHWNYWIWYDKTLSFINFIIVEVIYI